MDVKHTILAIVVLALLVDHATAGIVQFYRDLFFNRTKPTDEELKSFDKKCMPGTTYIKIAERENVIAEVDEASDEFTRSRPGRYRRLYRGSDLDERCSICVCAVNGQHEACIKRPAGSLNECILFHELNQRVATPEPYEHSKNLAFRIRRDLIWHNDEIPYDPASKCYRGHSYYTNHDTPNDTTINYDDDITSLLDFKSQTACFFCVCSVSGTAASCISRSLWFCNYLRYLRNDKSARDMYANMFQQDRPTYFRQLSWRLRRTMDNSMFDLVDQVGGGTVEQGKSEPKTCVPFVSEYTDCNAENQCSGCTKCSCSAKGMWECQPVHLCNDVFETDKVDEELLDAAIEKLDFEKKTLNDKKRQFYTTLSSSAKKHKPIKIIGVIHSNNKRRPLNKTEKKKNTLSSISAFKKAIGPHMSIISIGNEDIVNDSTGIDIKDLNFTKLVTTVEKNESYNQTIGTIKKEDVSNESNNNTEEIEHSSKSINTTKENVNSNESTSATEKQNVTERPIREVANIDNSNKTIDSSEKKDKADLRIELKNQKLKQRAAASRYVPVPPKKDESQELLEMINTYKPEEKLREILSSRPRRSTAAKNNNKKHTKRSAEKTTKNRHTRNSNNNNNTVKFYSTVDELNEDTLKHTNISGTLQARRVELNMLPDISRRSNTINSNKSLHIDFNQPKAYNHITDNKIDVTDPDNKYDVMHEKLNVLFGNQTQKTKDKNLSKLVVNELNKGTEIIGDVNAPVTSNITFTSENDTLTAMAFIAGNLLNKLWNMEKDASGLTLETEDMKYEKISDLLDLFKEPLNLRQEAFLKSALAQLSNAIDKDRDIKNVTICQTIEDATKLIDSYNKSDEDESPSVTVIEEVPCTDTNSSKKDKSRYATIKAISKINNVLELIKKFENIQKNISALKNGSELSLGSKNNSTEPISKKLNTDPLLTKDEASSLNVFGNVLDKITKLLLPKSSNKHLANTVKSKNILNNHQNLKNNFMKMHNIDLNNMTVSAKDKLILDYITHINNNPDCILNKKHQRIDEKSLPSIEGNILLNLSEFFKMKSFADLVNLLKPPKEAETRSVTPTIPRKKTVTSTIITSTVELTTVPSVAEKNKKFTSTKEKLKAHLKSIIEDLIELQNSKGIVPRSNIRIADALPCIYRIMNAGKDIPYKINEQSSPDRIVDIFNSLKKEMKEAQTRRSDSVMKVRPKSAVVLERVIKNFVEKSKVQTRRFAKIKVSKPVDDLKKIMSRLRNVSSIYKNQALYDEVPAAEKLVLLKTLAEDVRNYIIALEGIKQSYQNLNQLPPDQYEDIASFINNSVANISLDAKVVKKVEKLDAKNHIIDDMDTSNHIFKDKMSRKTLPMLSGRQDDDDNMKISRNQIINHLIANRMKIYIKMKEAKEFDLSNDMNYNIAKRVLFYLDSGNYNLAHELFKVLVMQKHEKLGNSASDDRPSELVAPAPKILDIVARQDRIPRLLPVVQLDEPTTPSHQMKWMSQDHLIKQLLNIKNMGL